VVVERLEKRQLLSGLTGQYFDRRMRRLYLLLFLGLLASVAVAWRFGMPA
jgi:hypothetical protein